LEVGSHNGLLPDALIRREGADSNRVGQRPWQRSQARAAPGQGGARERLPLAQRLQPPLPRARHRRAERGKRGQIRHTGSARVAQQDRVRVP
jgi:hypothetical protein